ncbi:MAG: fatty acid desaturase [Bacteroidota bacterium]
MSSINSSLSHPTRAASIAKYQSSVKRKSIWQLCNSFLPFFASWYLMYLSLGVSYWLTLLLALPTAGFFVRMFIIQHDCGHGSFFNSRKANDLWGMISSVFTLTPYHYWRKSHAIHHANAGKLENRGIGDIYTMTVDEYLQKSSWGKFKYRLYRNPFILFILFPPVLFTIVYRFPLSKANPLKQIRRSVYLTDLAIALVSGGMIWLVGLKAFLLVQVPITLISSSTGAWLFYVQHQFEDTYWSGKPDWDVTKAALQGSSYYELPKVLQWFTGNIGFHHVHHLNPRIPNYSLEKCHEENPMFQKTVVLTLRSSLQSLPLRLWDKGQHKLISFSVLRRRQQEGLAGLA